MPIAASAACVVLGAFGKKVVEQGQSRGSFDTLRSEELLTVHAVEKL